MTDILPTASPKPRIGKYTMQAVDFVERVAMTFLEAFLTATLFPGDHLPSVKLALGTAAFAAGKFVLLKVSAWQAAHAND